VKRERLIEYLDRRLGIHTGNGSELQFHCPACLDRLGSEGDSRKFALNIDKQKGRCFRCEFAFRSMEQLFRYMNGGNVTPQERIMLQREPPMVETSISNTVRELLCATITAKAESLKKHRLPTGAKLLDASNTQRMPFKRALRYITKERGFTLEHAMRFKTHYCARGEYAGYLIFPVYQGGELVFWTSRYCGHHRLKSRNPKKDGGRYGREHCLLGFDEVVGEKIVALVEGPIDRWAPPAAVALMGKEMSTFQIQLVAILVELGLEELVIMLDPGTGVKIDQIYAATVDFVPKVRVCYLDEDDPAERKDEMDELMEQRRVPTLSDRIRSRLS